MGLGGVVHTDFKEGPGWQGVKEGSERWSAAPLFPWRRPGVDPKCHDGKAVRTGCGRMLGAVRSTRDPVLGTKRAKGLPDQADPEPDLLAKPSVRPMAWSIARIERTRR